MNNVFDFIAFLLSDVGNSISTYAGIEHKSIKLVGKDELFLNKFIEELKAFHQQQGNDSYNSIIRDGIPDSLFQKYIKNDAFRRNKDAVYFLVSEIAMVFLNSDNLLEASQEAYQIERFNHNSIGFRQLNSNDSVQKTGYILLPDLGTFGGKNSSSSVNFEKIHLNHLIILTPSDLVARNGERFEIRNILPLKSSHQSGNMVDQVLTIAVSPLTDRWLLNDQPKVIRNNYDNEEYLFTCEGITDENLVMTRVNAAYQEACAHRAQILVFPEMYGTKELSVNAADIISNTTSHPGPLVVMPSWWHDCKNKASFLDENLGFIYGQNKHFPFLYNITNEKYKHPSLEKLRNSDYTIYLYHLPTVGRICICICKDFLMDSYRRILSERLEASIILVPAFSPKSEHFTNCLDELRHAGTYGVFVNCCAALCNKTGTYSPVTADAVIGEVTSTRSFSNRDDPPLYLLKPECNGSCENRDTCVFIIQIRSDGNISANHVCKSSYWQ